jgi:hypothetical protein
MMAANLNTFLYYTNRKVPHRNHPQSTFQPNDLSILSSQNCYPSIESKLSGPRSHIYTPPSNLPTTRNLEHLHPPLLFFLGP